MTIKVEEVKDQSTLVDRYSGTSAAVNPDDVWEVHNNIILTHDAVMRIANYENIHFQPPTVYQTADSVALLVVGEKCNEKNEVVNCMWTFGEASGANCTNAYTWAMAEKRAKDRVTLMLIGAYEYGIYSDVEADEFRNTNKTMKKAPSTVKTQTSHQKTMKTALKDIMPDDVPDWVTDVGDENWRNESAFVGGKNAGIPWKELDIDVVAWAMDNHKSDRVQSIAKREMEARELEQAKKDEQDNG